MCNSDRTLCTVGAVFAVSNSGFCSETGACGCAVVFAFCRRDIHIAPTIAIKPIIPRATPTPSPAFAAVDKLVDGVDEGEVLCDKVVEDVGVDCDEVVEIIGADEKTIKKL